jgi:hypothetical protein
MISGTGAVVGGTGAVVGGTGLVDTVEAELAGGWLTAGPRTVDAGSVVVGEGELPHAATSTGRTSAMMSRPQAGLRAVVI